MIPEEIYEIETLKEKTKHRQVEDEIHNIQYVLESIAEMVDSPWNVLGAKDILTELEDFLQKKDKEIERLQLILWKNHLSSEDSSED